MKQSIVGYATWSEGSKAELYQDGTVIVTHGGNVDARSSRNFTKYYRGWDRNPTLYFGQGILPDIAKLMGGRSVFHLPERPTATNIIQ
jgi:hypothetical protein